MRHLGKLDWTEKSKVPEREPEIEMPTLHEIGWMGDLGAGFMFGLVLLCLLIGWLSNGS